MKRFFMLALAFAPVFVAAGDRFVLLVNGTHTDVSVEVGTNEPVLELEPNESKSVAIDQLRWVRFGQEAYRYEIKAIQVLAKRSATPIVLQAHPNGWLYVLPAGTSGPTANPPPQPRGFPVKPNRKIDLT